MRTPKRSTRSTMSASTANAMAMQLSKKISKINERRDVDRKIENLEYRLGQIYSRPLDGHGSIAHAMTLEGELFQLRKLRNTLTTK